MKDSSDKNLPFPELAKKWEPMLNKFASWKFGVEYDDLYQEMLVLLYRVQQKWDPSRNASFITYLYRACINRVRHLRHVATELKTRIPQNAKVPLCDGETCNHPSIKFHPIVSDDVSGIDVLVGASDNAKTVAALLAKGIAKDKLTLSGITQKQADHGLQELTDLLKGDRFA